ncbi:MAG: DUF3667 domain-containing protein [Flavobacterium sp.]|nr:MAG: DUF3667 domain-containing protein [Flavobacterium sp.]
MDNMLCLNCSHEITKNFCANCGQKANTHRITFRHFITHDLLHGVWHIERGILFTAKQALVRPGQAALDYIAGKRIRYYNVFYLCLLVIGVHLALTHLYDAINPARLKSDPDDQKVIEFLSHYLKVILLGVVPVIAFNAKLLFGRLKLNWAEHFIISGVNLLGMLLVSIFFLFFNFINGIIPSVALGWLEVIAFLALAVYPSWTYGNAIKGKYSWLGKCWRLTFFNFLIIIETLAIFSLIFYSINHNSDLIINL